MENSCNVHVLLYERSSVINMICSVQELFSYQIYFGHSKPMDVITTLTNLKMIE